MLERPVLFRLNLPDPEPATLGARFHRASSAAVLLLCASLRVLVPAGELSLSRGQADYSGQTDSVRLATTGIPAPSVAVARFFRQPASEWTGPDRRRSAEDHGKLRSAKVSWLAPETRGLRQGCRTRACLINCQQSIVDDISSRNYYVPGIYFSHKLIYIDCAFL